MPDRVRCLRWRFDLLRINIVVIVMKDRLIGLPRTMTVLRQGYEQL